MFTVNKIFDGNALFLKFWIYPFPPIYKKVALPGGKKGISGTTITGFNVGITKHIDENKKDAAIKAFKFITSKENQKQLVKKGVTVPGIPSFYDDEEVCERIDCELYKSQQPIFRFSNKTNDYDLYSKQYRYYMYKYLYEDKDINEVLREVDDITKIYHFSINDKESKLGLIFAIIIIVTASIMIITLILPFIENIYPFFSFLSRDSWIILIMRVILILCSSFTKFGDVSLYKCSLFPIMLNIGISLIFIPILYKLIMKIPEENVYSKWVQKNKYFFIIGLIIIESLLSSMFLLNTFRMKIN